MQHIMVLHVTLTACFNHIDELCGILQSTRERLQQLWDGKGAKLDQVLQLRIFENDTRQLMEWVEYEQGSLAQQHTDIGSSPSTAQRANQSFEEFRARLKVSLYLQSEVKGHYPFPLGRSKRSAHAHL